MSKQIVSKPGDSPGQTKPVGYTRLSLKARTSAVRMGCGTKGTVPSGRVRLWLAYEGAE
jgi:hypothetical protein